MKSDERDTAGVPNSAVFYAGDIAASMITLADHDQ